MLTEVPDSAAPPSSPVGTGALIGRAAFLQSPVSMVVYDAAGRLLAVNPAFERLWGASIHDAPPDYCVLTDPQLESQGVLPLIRRAFAGETVTLPPVRYDIAAAGPHGVGRALWTQAHLYAIRGADGDVEQVVLTHEDVTARHAAEVELRASEARFRAAVQATSDILWTNDADGRMVGEQPDWAEFTGQSRQEYEGFGWAHAVHPDDAGPTVEAWSEAVATRRPFAVEHRVRRRDGVYRVFAVRAVPVLAEDGSLLEWVGVQRDVTDERARAAELEIQNRVLQAQATALEAQTEELRATTAELLRQTAEAVRAREAAESAASRAQVLQEVTGALAGATTAAAVTDVIISRALPALGASVGMLAVVSADGSHLELVSSANIPPDVASSFRRYPITLNAPMAEVVRGGHAMLLTSREEMLARFPNRAPLWERFAAQSVYAVPVLRERRPLAALMFLWPERVTIGPEVTSFVAVLADQCALAIERARLLEAESAARAAAEKANAAKSDFLSKMSHELRTPLNAVGGYVELLDMGLRGPVTDQQRSDFARIRRAQQYLLSLINDLLNYARLDAGQVDVQVADVELGPLFDDLDALVGAQIQSKGLVYDRSGGPNPGPVRADPEKVRQILVNLLSNALKFTSPGGRVTLACRDGAAAVDAEGPASVLRIDVSDTGRGIPADRLESVFEPFVQIDRHLTNSSQQGVGLGLAISRELARAMGGELSVASVEGQGTTFTLTLPRP